MHVYEARNKTVLKCTSPHSFKFNFSTSLPSPRIFDSIHFCSNKLSNILFSVTFRISGFFCFNQMWQCRLLHEGISTGVFFFFGTVSPPQNKNYKPPWPLVTQYRKPNHLLLRKRAHGRGRASFFGSHWQNVYFYFSFLRRGDLILTIWLGLATQLTYCLGDGRLRLIYIFCCSSSVWRFWFCRSNHHPPHLRWFF